MPKRSSTAYASDDGIVEDAAPSSKRAKSSPSSSSANAKKKSEDKIPVNTQQQTDDNGDPFWELSAGGTRRVTVNSFKGKMMVNVREYYEKDGQRLPGKKGISMPADQFAVLVEALPGIERCLKEKGESVPRPHYSSTSGTEERNGDDGDGEEKAVKQKVNSEDDEEDTKKNFEATSDEDGG